MTIDRQLWCRGLREKYAPAWPCPSCRHGTLGLMPGTLHSHTTAQPNKILRGKDYSIYEIEHVFSALLKCERCGEIISCCGNGGYEQSYVQTEEGDYEIDPEKVFYAKYFYKPLKIFKAPAPCPGAVKKQLYASFEMFFCDLSAAANHLRQCAEEILTNAGIPARGPKGGFRLLDARIQDFKKCDSHNAERMLAIKWIGNSGSHPEELKRDDLFDAYAIIDVILEDLYVGHQRHVRAITEQINSSKGPRR